jgi:hypothetical protein
MMCMGAFTMRLANVELPMYVVMGCVTERMTLIVTIGCVSNVICYFQGEGRNKVGGKDEIGFHALVFGGHHFT